MKTTTAMTPMTETTTATGPSLWSRLCPLRFVDVDPDASARGAWAATTACITPRAGAPVTAISQNIDPKSAAPATLMALRRNRPAGWRRSVEGMVVLDRPGGVPVLVEERIAVGIMLRAVDPLPAAQKCLLRESAILCRPL
jgi:hypothetical protein